MRRVAIGSKDGISITEHFGQAEQFLIYELDDDGAAYHLVETRKNDFSNAGNHQSKTMVIAELLSDVQVVFVSRIGPEAIQALQQKGIKAVELSIPVDKALKAYAKRGKLLDTDFLATPSSGGGCSGKGCSGGCSC